MNKQFRIVRLALGVLAIIGALVVTSTASAKNPKEVKMTIEDNQLVITSSKKDNDCTIWKPRGPGCIKVLRGKESKIYFHLTGNTRCTLASGTEWELNAVYLGGYNSASKPSEFGFDTTPVLNYNKVNADFNIADKTTGEVTLTEDTATKIGINNKNHSQYVVWYKIEAICKRSDGNPTPYVTTSDPRVRNDGGSG